MNRNVIKYIAIVAMTLDHIGGHFINLNPILAILFKTIGRITFPIMCFFICEGFKYTKDKRKYGLRLLILALISQIPWTLLHSNTLLTLEFFTNLNTLFTLFLGFCLIYVIEGNINYIYKSLLIVLITALSFLCDYSIIGLIFILFFYLLDDNKYKLVMLMGLYIVTTLLSIFIDNIEGANLVITIIVNLGLLFTIPILYLYNNKSGSKHVFHKYSFYIYYPLHMLVLFLIISLS